MPACRDVGPDEQRAVLLKRRGSTVGRRSILKSFTLPAAGALPAAPPALGTLDGVTEIRCAGWVVDCSLAAPVVFKACTAAPVLGVVPGPLASSWPP